MTSSAKPQPAAPLAEALRPQSLDEVVGQQHLLGPGQAAAPRLRVGQAAFDDPVGPAGLGQDDARAPDGAGLRRRVHRALGGALGRQGHPRRGAARAEQTLARSGRRTILFVDEVHRFNKAQQDAFLPFVERGLFTFIGATTENPSFEVNSALLSRATVYVLESLSEREDLRACCCDRTGSSSSMTGARARLIGFADGDARRLLNCRRDPRRLRRRAREAGIDGDFVEQTLAKNLRRFDKGGEQFYDQISALHKSVRGSDPDAALYWLVRMLDGGADPLYVGAAHGAHGGGGHRPRRPARAARRARRLRNLRAAGHARGRARARRGGDLPRGARRSRTRSTSPIMRRARFRRGGRHAAGAAAHPQRADEADEGPRLRQGLPLRARRGGRLRGGRELLSRGHAGGEWYRPTDRGLEGRSGKAGRTAPPRRSGQERNDRHPAAENRHRRASRSASRRAAMRSTSPASGARGEAQGDPDRAPSSCRRSATRSPSRSARRRRRRTRRAATL